MTILRIALVLVTCALLVGCKRTEREDREIVNGLEVIKHELATNRPTSTRWAFANRREIQSAIDRWSQEEIDRAIRAEALRPEEAEKLRQYEALNSELGRMPYPGRIDPATGLPYPGYINPATGLPVASAGDTNKLREYEALSARVEQARAPVASVLDRRDRQAEQIRKQYTPDPLVAEYIGDRFDLVVDSGDPYSFYGPLLYRSSGEAVDITEGVLKLFKQKTRQ